MRPEPSRAPSVARRLAALLLALGACAHERAGTPGAGETAAAPPGPVRIEAAFASGPVGLDPGDPAWRSAPEQTIPFVQFLDSAGTQTGPTSELLKVRALQDGEELFLRVAWQDASRDEGSRETDGFADALAVQFASDPRKVLCMGSPKAPANLFFWRANLPKPQNLTAAGTGTPQPTADPGSQNLRSAQAWAGGAWTVVLARKLSATGQQVGFERGKEYPVSFARWNGSNADRDGRKAYTDWHVLVIR